ncbi:MAG TPA: hydrogenase [Deltaproteobacteria bacterium]|nr:hydrogenase [Deltaproteobacteria bacterium]
MESADMKQGLIRALITLGVLLILLGLVTGLLVPELANPRMALASHMEGVMSGMLLVVMGLIWHRLNLGSGFMRAAAGLLAYGALANWLNPLLGAVWAAGSSVMPMAGMGHRGTPAQEAIIGFLAVTLALSLLAGMGLVLSGLLRKGPGAA